MKTKDYRNSRNFYKMMCTAVSNIYLSIIRLNRYSGCTSNIVFIAMDTQKYSYDVPEVTPLLMMGEKDLLHFIQLTSGENPFLLSPATLSLPSSINIISYDIWGFWGSIAIKTTFTVHVLDIDIDIKLIIIPSLPDSWERM